MVVRVCNSIAEEMVVGLGVQDQPGKHSKTLSQIEKKGREKERNKKETKMNYTSLSTTLAQSAKWKRSHCCLNRALTVDSEKGVESGLERGAKMDFPF